MIAGLMAAFAMAAAPAPDPRDAEVTRTVQRFFDAMAKEDRAAIAEVVLPGSVFTAVRAKAEGGTSTGRLTVEDFARTQEPAACDELKTRR
ncbi:hypothetical protein [Phenylobacterium sp.]|uniref:hypothetical protein n=1 Tax=Phenylobacterium sp. TaxID=1871053 RepID=UPI0025E87E4E|nr:hypothetical protein [Phenylobacterium sp.]MBX3483204.1 hypothetical protein [Phenylobacterium sp.]